VKELLLTKRYVSAALANLPRDQHQQIYDQLQMMKDVMTANPEVYQILSSQIVKKEIKIEFVEELLSAFPNKDFWMKFFSVLIWNNRSNLIRRIFVEIEQSLNASLRIEHVKLVLAHNPDAETLSAISAEVEHLIDRKPIWDISIDKSILGGFIATTSQKIIDASIQTSLYRFCRRRAKWY
jgi:F-type H+-transporting ATPase subunit delta